MFVCVSEGEENGSGYDFGITSLTNKRELLQVGDPVQFQVDSDGRAANVTAIRAKKKATVESIKGMCTQVSFVDMKSILCITKMTNPCFRDWTIGSLVVF